MFGNLGNCANESIKGFLDWTEREKFSLGLYGSVIRVVRPIQSCSMTSSVLPKF